MRITEDIVNFIFDARVRRIRRLVEQACNGDEQARGKLDRSGKAMVPYIVASFMDQVEITKKARLNTDMLLMNLKVTENYFIHDLCNDLGINMHGTIESNRVAIRLAIKALRATTTRPEHLSKKDDHIWNAAVKSVSVGKAQKEAQS